MRRRGRLEHQGGLHGAGEALERILESEGGKEGEEAMERMGKRRIKRRRWGFIEIEKQPSAKVLSQR